MKRIIIALLLLLGFTCSTNATVYLLTQGTDYTNNNLIVGGYGKPFPMEQYKSSLKEGNRLIAVACTRLNGWVLSMAENTGIRLQHVSLSPQWPQEWVESEWGDGYQITSVAYGDGQWCVVTSLNCGLSQQVVKVGTYGEWGDFIHENWASTERQVTAWCGDMQQGRNTVWAIVMSSRDNSTPGQKSDFKPTLDKFKTGAETHFANDYFIECITYGTSNIGIIYNHGFGDGTTPHQIILTDAQEVNDYMQKGYVVTGIVNNF